MKNYKNISKKLDSILDFDSDKQKLEFEEMILSTDTMRVVQELMDSSDVNTRTKLAEKLKISTAHLSKLFSGDKYFNVKLLAKIQRIFNMRFKVVDSRSIIKVINTRNVFISFNIVPPTQNERVEQPILSFGDVSRPLNLTSSGSCHYNDLIQ